MTFTETTIQTATRGLKTRLRSCRRQHTTLSEEQHRCCFERWLISQLVKSAESVVERDEWELEEAALECLVLNHQRQLDLLNLDIRHQERLLELAKRQIPAKT